MAACPRPADGVTLNLLEVLCKLQSVGFCLDLGKSIENPGLVFGRILSVFLTEIYQQREARPLPAMLGEGRPLNLFALYRAVRRRGGYDLVTKNRSWAAVAEEIGMDLRIGSSLKLVYVKYLDALDRWLLQVLDKEAGDRMDFNVDLHDVLDHKKREGESTPGSGSKKDQFLSPVKRNVRNLELDSSVDDDDIMVVETTAVNGEPLSLKRKREHLVGMLNWVRRLAKNPGDPFIQKVLVDGTKSKAHAFQTLFAQVLLVREAMYLKKIPRANSDRPLVQCQKQQKIYPSICDDHTGSDSQNDEKRRCSHGVHSVGNQCLTGSETSTVVNGDAEHGPTTSTQATGHGYRQLRNSSLLADLVARFLYKDHIQKRIPVGPFFQAEVPEWTGVASESDSDSLKWLGTRIWPPDKPESKPPLECDPIGQGRQDACLCEFPGSVDCFRFHVAEKRFRLKRELGSAFHSWGFDRMGEEIALSWTEEEEQKFKEIVHRHPSYANRTFLDQLHLCFPSRRRRDLVSYYFNVFLLRRRSYQNRVTPNGIDSDDEESEFGFLSNSFGHDAVKFHVTKSIFCAQNRQCIDFDGFGNVE